MAKKKEIEKKEVLKITPIIDNEIDFDAMYLQIQTMRNSYLQRSVENTEVNWLLSRVVIITLNGKIET